MIPETADMLMEPVETLKFEENVTAPRIEIANRKVSFFESDKGIKNVIPKEPITLKNVHYLITRNPELKSKISKLHVAIQSGDETVETKIKLSLPFITTSGTFTYRDTKHFESKSYNWIIPFDIDRKDNTGITDWDELYDTIIKDPYILLAFHSPRKGIKGIVNLKPNGFDHLSQYEVCKNVIYPYYEKQWGVVLDDSQGAFPQPLFLSHDPDAYVNWSAKEKSFNYEYDFTVKALQKEVLKDHASVNCELDNFVLLLTEKQEEKWAYFGRVALLVGGLYAGGGFDKSLTEAVILAKLVNAVRTNKWVVNPDVAENQVRSSFDNGKKKPILPKDLVGKTAVNKILLRLALLDNPNCEYIRVGNDYHKKSFNPDGEPVLLGFKRQTIIDEFGYDYLDQIPRYDQFCNEPDNINYKAVIRSSYNLYQAFTHQPESGCFPTIEKLYKHVFGDQLQMGYDYTQLLYEKPKQVLPVLGLVSQEQQTGKSTFLEFLATFFQGNTAILSTADIEGNFNQHFINKLLIMVDESDLHKEITTSKIKQMATQFSSIRRAKFQDETKTKYFGKLIVASNAERNFINIKSDDVRYWVRKLGKVEFYDPDFEQKLRDEIPTFLYFLKNRKLINDTKQSRAWFNTGDLNTEWLAAAKEQGRSQLYIEINEIFTEWFLNHPKEQEFHVTNKQIVEHVLENKHQSNVKYVAGVMRDEFKIEVGKTSSRFHSPFDGSFDGNRSTVGFFYCIKREVILKEGVI